MQETYNGWKIEYRENQKMSFIANKDEIELSSKSLNELKKEIDAYDINNFKKVPIYFGNYTLFDAEIISITSQDTNGNIYEVMVSFECDGEKIETRETTDYYTYDRFFVRNQANAKIVKEIKKLQLKEDILSEKISKLRSELEIFDVTKELNKKVKKR